MTRYGQFCILVGIMACAAATLCAQTGRDPYVAYLYPAGGRQGASFTVTAGGQRLRGISGAFVTGGGVQVKVIGYVGANGLLNFAQQEELRRRLRELAERWRGKKSGDNQPPAKEQPAPDAKTPDTKTPDAKAPAADRKPVTLPDLPELRDLEKKTPRELRAIADKFLNRNKRPKPPMAEVATLEITIDPAAAPGDRELRLRTPAGLSNPLVFQVGQLPEAREPDRGDPEAEPLSPLDAPVVLNGQIMPGEVDRFPLQLRGGQQVMCLAEARCLIPYLADAVPGWFQAVMALYDANGKRLAYADDCGFDPDPVLVCQVPADGKYTLEIRDALYRGRWDFVYRVAIGDPPQIGAMLPSGSRGGVTLAAPAGAQTAPSFGAGLPHGEEVEPNDTAKQAQSVILPRVISGCIARAGDVDLYPFTGRAGDEVVAEVYARRAGSPLDALLRVLDASGRVLAWNDDFEDKSAGLLTHQADARMSVKLPADGTYYVQVSDAQRHGGESYRYALRLSPPQADFALRMTPSTLNLAAGRAAVVTVTAMRRDGWNGEIEIALKDAPAGFTLSGARIPTGRDTIRMTLAAPTRVTKEPFTLTLEGRAQVDGKTLIRPVLPADQMMQAFAYYHLVPAQQLTVLVTGGWRAAPSITVPDKERVRIPAGGQVEVACGIRPMPQVPLQLELSDPPAGVTLQEVKVNPDGVTLVLRADDKHTGYTDNLIVVVSTETEFKREGAASRKLRVPLGVLPAIPFEIVAP